MEQSFSAADRSTPGSANQHSPNLRLPNQRLPNLQLLAASLVLQRANGIDAGAELGDIDRKIASVGLKIEASDDLRGDPLLAKFARLSSSLLEGENQRRERSWEELEGMVDPLVRASAAAEVQLRIDAIDHAAAQARQGLLTKADLAALDYVAKSLIDALERANSHALHLIAVRDGLREAQKPTVETKTAAKPSADAPHLSRSASAGNQTEIWELRALRGSLTPSEALKLADLDPTADDRTRLQHRQSLQAGGVKALGAVWLALQVLKSTIQADAKLAPRPDTLARLEDAERAVANVESAMKDAGWRQPERLEPERLEPRDLGADMLERAKAGAARKQMQR
jgi:hypothetical protein